MRASPPRAPFPSANSAPSPNAPAGRTSAIANFVSRARPFIANCHVEQSRNISHCSPVTVATRKPSVLVDTRVIYCGDNLDQLRKLPEGCVDLIYIDPPFNSNRNYEVFWGETKEKRAFEDRHESTRAYIDYMRPRCVELARVLKKTGSFYYHCDWHASHYVKVMLDQIFGENNFENEVIWKRHTAHADTHGFGHVHDILFRYSNGDEPTFNVELKSYPQAY